MKGRDSEEDVINISFSTKNVNFSSTDIKIISVLQKKDFC